MKPEWWPTSAGGMILRTPYLRGFVQELKATVPPGSRYWSTTDKMWYIDPSHAAQAEAAFQRFFVPVDGPVSPWWARALHIQPDAPLVVVEAAYRVLAKAAHPDRGGRLERSQELNLAVEAARAVRTEERATTTRAGA